MQQKHKLFGTTNADSLIGAISKFLNTFEMYSKSGLQDEFSFGLVEFSTS